MGPKETEQGQESLSVKLRIIQEAAAVKQTDILGVKLTCWSLLCLVSEEVLSAGTCSLPWPGA